MLHASAAATRPLGPLLHLSWGAWDRGKWPSRRAEGLPAPLLAHLCELDCRRMGAGVQTVADALRRFEAVGALPSGVAAYLIALDEQAARRRKARHTGRRPTELEQVARVLLAAFSDPASGVTFAAVQAKLTKTLYNRLLTLLPERRRKDGDEVDRHTTVRRAVRAIASGKFGSVPP